MICARLTPQSATRSRTNTRRSVVVEGAGTAVVLSLRSRRDLSRSRTGLLPRQPLETLFPRLVLALGVAQERGGRYPLEQRAVDAGGRPPQRPDHVQPQDHPRLIGVVPRGVLVTVVEEHRRALGPVPRLAVHRDPA